MTKLQYENWKDFAFRMAKVCFSAHRRPSGQWIREVVEDFFESFYEPDIDCVVSWDHSTPYPEGNPCRRREYNLTWCGCDGYRMENDHKPNPNCGECGGTGVWNAWVKPMPVCDMLRMFLDHYMPNAICKPCEDYDYDADCQCNEIEEKVFNQWEEQWAGPVHCCIRAGLDTAAEASMGVVGFTAGDLRRMYPGGVPDWVSGGDEKWTVHRMAPVPLGMIETAPPEVNGTFAEMPDDAGVWL